MTTKERGPARAPSKAPMRLIGLAEVAELLGRKRQRAWYWTNRPGFPDPVGETRAGGRLWSLTEVRRWIRANRHRLNRQEPHS